ncbi:MAG: hypothetical protein ACKPKO_65085, partial [Candidatus Fonsibacter sp.]
TRHKGTRKDNQTCNYNASWDAASPMSWQSSSRAQTGTTNTTTKQDAYLERLRGCNVATLVSSNYDEIVIFLHEHYKDVNETHKMLLAIEDKQQTTRIVFRATKTLPTSATTYRTKRASSRSASAEDQWRLQKHADSQQVDLTRQTYGGYAQIATCCCFRSSRLLMISSVCRTSSSDRGDR